VKNFSRICRDLPEPQITEISEDYYLETLFIEGSSPTIVFIHGGGGNLRNPYLQLDHFRGEYSLLTYSLSGYEESSYRKNQDLEKHVEDLRKLIESYNLDRVVLHGHSYGTEIAIEYAKKYDPEALVLVGGGAYDLTPEWEKPLLKIMLALRLYKLPTNTWLMKKLAKKALHPETSEKRIEDFLKSNPMPHRRSAWDTIVRSFWEYDAGNLKEIECPSLVLHGSRDGIVPIDVARKTAKNIPRAKFKQIERAGHVPMAEQPETYNRILQDFLERRL